MIMVNYLICFVLGVFTGATGTRIFDIIAFREAKRDRKSFYDLAMSKESMRWFVATIVMATFLSAVVAELFDSSYKVNYGLYGLMGTVVGYLFFFKKDEPKK